MTTVAEMLRTYPKDLGGVDREKLRDCIEGCLDCAQTCTACADACLSEDMVAELTKCIRTYPTAPTSAPRRRGCVRHTGYDANISRAVLEACADGLQGVRRRVRRPRRRCTSIAGSVQRPAGAARPPALASLG